MATMPKTGPGASIRTVFGRALIKAELIAATPRVRRIPFWSRDAIDRLVNRRLRNTVQTACQQVPWYHFLQTQTHRR